MPHVDLDAARAARAEALGEPPFVTLAGREYKLKPEVTVEAGRQWRAALASNDPGPWLAEVLLDPSEADDFAATPDLSWPDLTAIYDAWSTSAGESSASSRSSTPDGTRSRPTSKRTTTST